MRASWFHKHPPACTCAACDEVRLGRAAKPPVQYHDAHCKCGRCEAVRIRRLLEQASAEAEAAEAKAAEAAQQHPHNCACAACAEKRLRLLRAAPRRPTAPFNPSGVRYHEPARDQSQAASLAASTRGRIADAAEAAAEAKANADAAAEARAATAKRTRALYEAEMLAIDRLGMPAPHPPAPKKHWRGVVIGRRSVRQTKRRRPHRLRLGVAVLVAAVALLVAVDAWEPTVIEELEQRNSNRAVGVGLSWLDSKSDSLQGSVGPVLSGALDLRSQAWAWAQTIEWVEDVAEVDGQPLVPAEETQPATSPAEPVAVEVRPDLRHIKEKQYMLELINAERIQAGLNPVVLGDNVAAQLHAEASLNGCFSSHWGLDGLKPHMRYSLAGGYQPNGENGLGSNYCIKAYEGYEPIADVYQELREAMEGWMDSPGHRDNILRLYHKQVNIGLAWDRYNFKAAQQFEGDYVEYDRLPAIDGGMLSFSGTVKNGARFVGDSDLGVQVYYDSPPHALTRGQVARTYCYDSGLQIASLRPPPGGRSYYREDTYTRLHKSCPDPYAVPADAPAPWSLDKANELWGVAYRASQNRKDRPITVPWVTAGEWTASDESFSVTADLSGQLALHGSGVYSIFIWGNISGQDVLISEYSIFHDVALPDTYKVDARVDPTHQTSAECGNWSSRPAPPCPRNNLPGASAHFTGSWRTHEGCASNQSGLPVSLLRDIRFSWAGRDPHRERTGHNFKQQRVPTGGLSAGNRRGFQWFGLRHHRLQGGPGDHHRPRWQWQRAGEVLNTS